MKEELIKDENIKLLSEIGFIYPILAPDGLLIGEIPTQSFVQKWLRDEHGINIFMCFKPNIKKWHFIPYNMCMNGIEYVKYVTKYDKTRRWDRYDTYEEALECGIMESLQMILKIK